MCPGIESRDFYEWRYLEGTLLWLVWVGVCVGRNALHNKSRTIHYDLRWMEWLMRYWRRMCHLIWDQVVSLHVIRWLLIVNVGFILFTCIQLQVQSTIPSRICRQYGSTLVVGIHSKCQVMLWYNIVEFRWTHMIDDPDLMLVTVSWVEDTE